MGLGEILLFLALLFGAKQKWWWYFAAGLVWDLIKDNHLGQTAVIYLGVGMLVQLIKQNFPSKISGEVKLRE